MTTQQRSRSVSTVDLTDEALAAARSVPPAREARDDQPDAHLSATQLAFILKRE